MRLLRRETNLLTRRDRVYSRAWTWKHSFSELEWIVWTIRKESWSAFCQLSDSWKNIRDIKVNLLSCKLGRQAGATLSATTIWKRKLKRKRAALTGAFKGKSGSRSFCFIDSTVIRKSSRITKPQIYAWSPLCTMA